MFHLSGGAAAREDIGTDSLGTWLKQARAVDFWPF
jgi:hypothetical protein